MVIAIYGDFEKKDVRMKLIKSGGTEQFAFQNVLQSAGYDCNIYFVSDEEIKPFLDETQSITKGE